MAERHCRHKPCACEPDAGVPYCSTACEQAEGALARINPRPEMPACSCGHHPCDPERARDLADAILSADPRDSR